MVQIRFCSFHADVRCTPLQKAFYADVRCTPLQRRLIRGDAVGDDVLGVPFKPIFVHFIRTCDARPYGRRLYIDYVNTGERFGQGAFTAVAGEHYRLQPFHLAHGNQRCDDICQPFRVYSCKRIVKYHRGLFLTVQYIGQGKA